MSDKTGESGLFPKHGGFEKLLSYQVAELLLDITVRFIQKHINPSSRTRDQMEQAARSGSRNISEGSVFSATSKKIEMNLTNVARASLVELKKDYAAFLRQRKLTLWPIPDPIRQELIDRRFKTVDEVAAWGADLRKRASERTVQEIAGNIGHTYCMVAIGLLDRQLAAQARDFKENGGFSEHLYKLRKQGLAEGKKPSPAPSDQKSEEPPGTAQ